MYHVQRAIIMAAGIGKRMQPISLHTPKPLISVNGTRMIDSVIGALHQNGIYEIYVVVGYLKEQFAPLAQQYAGVTLIENPYFDTCNNISSLYAAREHLSDVIILDADQLIVDPSVLHPDFERSGYNAIRCCGHTDEWLLQVQNGIVTSCSRNGGEDGWQLFSVSRWNRQDGARLKMHLEFEFEVKQNRQIYWDDVALFCHPEAYSLGICPMQAGDVLEIDSVAELAAIDPTYKTYLEGK